MDRAETQIADVVELSETGMQAREFVVLSDVVASLVAGGCGEVSPF